MKDMGLRDQEIVAELSQNFNREKAGSVGGRIVRLGLHFLGTPYAAGTLERQGAEMLVTNLRAFDCFTFLENVVALTYLFLSGTDSFTRYRDILTFIRYRQGRLDGYTSRLHYFSDWLCDNQRKGIVKDISPILGGRPLSKKIHFMTEHADQYPALENHEVYRQMRAVERRIQRRVHYYIPKAAVKGMEGRIAEGDLIAVTARIEGLDVNHTGIAIHLGRRLHLLHASSLAGRVIVSTDTLDRYLAGNKACSGVMVARMVAPA